MRETAAIQGLLAIAREKFVADLRTDVSVFDHAVWDVSSLRDRSTTTSNPRPYFTRHATVDQPLPAAYGNVVKCWLILDRHSVANMVNEPENHSPPFPHAPFSRTVLAVKGSLRRATTARP